MGNLVYLVLDRLSQGQILCVARDFSMIKCLASPSALYTRRRLQNSRQCDIIEVIGPLDVNSSRACNLRNWARDDGFSRTNAKTQKIEVILSSFAFAEKKLSSTESVRRPY